MNGLIKSLMVLNGVKGLISASVFLEFVIQAVLLRKIALNDIWKLWLIKNEPLLFLYGNSYFYGIL